MHFDGFAGNQKLKERLSAIADSGNIPQAIIFEGKKGLGKKTLATLFAKALLCREHPGAPCQKCPSCIKICEGSHPDVKVIDGSDSKNLSVDAMRDLRFDSFIKPNESKYKIYLILDADSMQHQAQNAILKILEEPPLYCIFIFTCENRSCFLPTVLSRAVTMELFPVQSKEAQEVIAHALPNADNSEIQKAVDVFSGNIGNALSSLCSGGFSKLCGITSRVINSLTVPNEMELLRLTAEFEGDKELFFGCVSMLSLAVRDALVSRFGSSTKMSGFDLPELSGFNSLTVKQLIALNSELDSFKDLSFRNPNQTLLITRFCSQMRKACGR